MVTDALPPADALPTAPHCLRVQVQIFDTDCYGVMWHGAYTKWLEMARAELLVSLGYPLAQADADHMVFPVVTQDLAFKRPAKLWDTLLLWSRVDKHGSRAVFTQWFTTEDGQATVMTATTTCALMQRTETGSWRPARTLPTGLAAVFALSTEVAET